MFFPQKNKSLANNIHTHLHKNTSKVTDFPILSVYFRGIFILLLSLSFLDVFN